MLHLPPLYKRFHKYHHAYKDPEPFDDMYIHPLEAFCYYCILYAPPFLFSCHIFAFISYMIVMGLAGTLDHSGIRVHVPGIYDASDHDRHHSKFNVNYAFPSPYLGTDNINSLVIMMNYVIALIVHMLLQITSQNILFLAHHSFVSYY